MNEQRWERERHGVARENLRSETLYVLQNCDTVMLMGGERVSAR